MNPHSKKDPELLMNTQIDQVMSHLLLILFFPLILFSLSSNSFPFTSIKLLLLYLIASCSLLEDDFLPLLSFFDTQLLIKIHRVFFFLYCLMSIKYTSHTRRNYLWFIYTWVLFTYKGSSSIECFCTQICGTEF